MDETNKIATTRYWEVGTIKADAKMFVQMFLPDAKITNKIHKIHLQELAKLDFNKEVMDTKLEELQTKLTTMNEEILAWELEESTERNAAPPPTDDNNAKQQDEEQQQKDNDLDDNAIDGGDISNDEDDHETMVEN